MRFQLICNSFLLDVSGLRIVSQESEHLICCPKYNSVDSLQWLENMVDPADFHHNVQCAALKRVWSKKAGSGFCAAGPTHRRRFWGELGARRECVNNCAPSLSYIQWWQKEKNSNRKKISKNSHGSGSFTVFYAVCMMCQNRNLGHFLHH